MYYTYILKSKVIKKYYIGSCAELSSRLDKHNAGNSRSTKSYVPWQIVYYEKFETKSEALKRERQLKKMKSAKYIEWLINGHSGGRPD